MLRVPLGIAQGFVAPLGQERFDSAVGHVLMNADLVLGEVEEGKKYRDNLMKLAADVMMPEEVARQRVLLLGGAAVESMVETALEEYRRMNEALVEVALHKATSLRNHPLWAALEAQDDKPYDVISVASRMVVSRMGLSLVSEVLRMLDTQKKRQISGSDGDRGGMGWGSATVVMDASYREFLEEFQAVLLSDYSDASMK